MNAFPPTHKNFPCITRPIIPEEPPVPKRLRPRKTASPDAFRLGYWGEHNDEAEALLSPSGFRYYKAEQALLWSLGYPKDNALAVLRRRIALMYAHEIYARHSREEAAKYFGTEVSATKSAAST